MNDKRLQFRIWLGAGITHEVELCELLNSKYQEQIIDQSIVSEITKKLLNITLYYILFL